MPAVLFCLETVRTVSIVKVYELPDEMLDSVVIGRLAHYGRIISFRRDRVADAILNSVRTARMFIERPIPTQTFIAGKFVRFWYPSQAKTCRKCGSEDHLAAACKSQRCFNCERLGHCTEQCDMPALCDVCLSDGHETSSCPFSYYSSNITGTKPTDKPAEKEKSYSGAAKTGNLVDAARKAEEDISRAKREEDERVRREERAWREERDRKEKEEKDRKEKERKEKKRRERKEREREEKDHEDRREREKRKHDKHYDRRHRDDDDYRRGERSDRFCPSRDRSSHRNYDHSGSESGSESEGWTKVSHRKHKSKSY